MNKFFHTILATNLQASNIQNSRPSLQVSKLNNQTAKP
jgi:hypothetical protein